MGTACRAPQDGHETSDRVVGTLITGGGYMDAAGMASSLASAGPIVGGSLRRRGEKPNDLDQQRRDRAIRQVDRLQRAVATALMVARRGPAEILDELSGGHPAIGSMGHQRELRPVGRGPRIVLHISAREPNPRAAQP